MTEEEFNEFTDVTIPCALFHVSPDDKDDNTGASYEEVVLIELIVSNISCLKHKPLRWFINTYLNDIKN